MKVFTKILLLTAGVAGIHAQISVQGASEKCTAAVEKFNNSSAGKSMDKCGEYYDAEDIVGFCSDSNCVNLRIPEDIKSGCKDGPMDMLVLNMMDEYMREINKLIKQECQNISGKTETKPKTTKVETKPETKTQAKPTTTTTVTKVEATPAKSEDKPSSSGSSSSSSSSSSSPAPTPTTPAETANNAPAANDAAPANAAVTNATPVTGNNANGANGANASTINNNVIQGNSTVTIPPATNNSTITDNSSSASKLSYSLVTALALAAFNLLL